MGTSHKDLEMFFILFLNTFQVGEHTSDSDFYNSLSSKLFMFSEEHSTFGCESDLMPNFSPSRFIATVGNKFQ